MKIGFLFSISYGKQSGDGLRVIASFLRSPFHVLDAPSQYKMQYFPLPASVWARIGHKKVLLLAHTDEPNMSRFSLSSRYKFLAAHICGINPSMHTMNTQHNDRTFRIHSTRFSTDHFSSVVDLQGS